MLCAVRMVPKVEAEELDEEKEHYGCELKLPNGRREDESSSDH